MRLLLPLLLWANLSFASVTITTTSIPNGTVGLTYSATVQAPGGCTPYQWEISSGTLPPGLALAFLSTKTYLTISGVPMSAGSYSFAVRVKGCGGHSSTKNYSVTISGPIVTLSWKPSSTAGVTYNVLRSTVSGGYYSQIASGLTRTNYVDHTVKPGQTYYYVTDAQDGASTSVHSNQVEAMIPR